MTLTKTQGSDSISTTHNSIFGGVQNFGLSFYAAWVYFDDITPNTVVLVETQVYDDFDNTMRTYKKTYMASSLAAEEPALFIPFVPTTRFDVLASRINNTGSSFNASWEFLRQPQV